jgi:signal peptidase I
LVGLGYEWEGLNKIRWDRVVQQLATDSHNPIKYFLIALAAFFIGEYFWKKRN